MTTRHFCNSLLKRYFIFNVTVKLDFRDLIQRYFLLNDDIFESQETTHLLPIFDSLFVDLQHHFLRSQELTNLCVYLLLELYTCQRCIDVDLCYLLICEDEKGKRNALWNLITFVFQGEDNWLLLSSSHCKNINIKIILIYVTLSLYIFMFGEQILPNFILTEEHSKQRVTVLLKGEAGSLPKQLQEEFKEKSYVIDGYHTFITDKFVKKYRLPQQCSVQFSSGFQNLANYQGLASTLLASAYNFNCKTAPKLEALIGINPETRKAEDIINLALALAKSQALANGRGDIFGSPDFFVQKAEQLASQNKLSYQILRGEQLLTQGLNLFHAVGRASNKQPALINIGYKGSPNSDIWLAYIGKGVCFDSGGLDIKSASGMKPMFLDKSGACSCFAAFQQIVKEGLKINVTITLGMVENFISKNSYRPSDIIRSKKGYTVEIDDTDSQGRLVLADCMTWTQQNYKVGKIVELSTLTYSCIKALGHERAGLFGNSETFLQLLKSTGEEVNELSWILPLDESHFELLSSKSADFLSDASEKAPGASIAAAFLEKFVEQGVEWAHMDVAGTCINFEENQGTGYGARLLLQLARKLAI